jgi:hypothetical protein
MSIDAAQARVFLELAREFGLTKLEIDGLKVEFGPAMRTETPLSDDSDERLSRVRQDLAALAKEQNEDLFWSADVPPPQES